MYPIRIRFHGIRDFQPTLLELGEKGWHVLIGGKNGSGKSTIVYALSFAMASGSTHIWSLRSKNLEEDQPWNALVGVLFHNPPGPEQKDAPEYVECIAEVNAGDTSRYSIKYSVFGGIHPDRMERLRVFSTRIAAEDYYRRVFNIDAEGYFMFWYQGSITDFANISDAERFQRVSEMFGIDRYEAEWKKAMEALADGERSLNLSKRQKLDNERTLRTHEKNRNDLITRNSIRDEGLAGVHHASKLYMEILDEREDELDKRSKQLDGKLEKSTARLNNQEKILRDKEASKKLLLKDRAVLTQNIQVVERELKELDIKWEDSQKEHGLLADQVAQIREEIKRVRSRETLQSLKGSLNEALIHLGEKIEELRKGQNENDQSRSHVEQKIGGLLQEEKNLSKRLEEEEALDKSLPPIMEITGELDGFRDELKGTQEVLAGDRIEEKTLTQRLNVLENTKSLMTEGQRELIEGFRSMGLEVAAFGELFDIVKEERREEVEELLAPIKHTVFVSRNISGRVTEGAFYVVSVEDFVDKMEPSSLLSLVKIPAEIGKKYSEEFIKGVLGWVSQIKTSISPDRAYALLLDKGVLTDSHGVRGRVQKGSAIGLRALEMERDRIRQKLSIIKIRIARAQGDEKELAGIIRDLENDLRQRERVNKSLPITRKNLKDTEDKLKENNRELEKINKILEEIKIDIDNLARENVQKELSLEQVEKELDIHKEHEQQAKNIARLEKLSEEIRLLDNSRRGERKKRTRYSEKMTDIEQKLIRLEDEKGLVSAQQRSEYNNKNHLEEEHRKTIENLKDVTIHLEELKARLQSLRKEFKDIYDNAVEKEIKLELEANKDKISNQYLERRLNYFEDRVQDARNRNVLENAIDRYNTFLKVFNDSAIQLEESELRFRKLKKDEENRRDDLNKMINKRYVDTNRLFKEYMSMLNLEGEIRNIPPSEERTNDSYKWEILVATREGHRLERVDRESSRRGRKGSGISGGERAATSLMFALALLSQIHVKPPFYVLDEFDSALDEGRKHKILDLYSQVLDRKMLIVSPKIHGKDYLDRFGKFHCVYSNPDIQKHREISEVYEITRLQYESADLED